MLQLDEVREVLERTERLAVRSAFALCLAFEMMQRSGSNPPGAVSDLEALRGEVERVSAALGEILSDREAGEDESTGVEETAIHRLH